MPLKLSGPPVVRRLDYIDDYLMGVENGYDKEELEEQLAETKKRLETEKALAVGRGNPFRKDIKKTSNLTYYCNRITKAMKLTEDGPTRLTQLGKKYLQSDNYTRKSIICEAFSRAYPHFGALVSALIEHETMILSLRNKPPFRPMVQKYGLDTHQVAFDTIRDLATDVGLVNWYTKGKADGRRQYVYLVCHLSVDFNVPFTVYHNEKTLYLVSNDVSIEGFRDNLWDNYIELVNGIPGAPVFYSVLRELVCCDLKISDLTFNNLIETLIEYDEKFNVIWSQGTLPRKQDSASMLKSLPPKNMDGNYIIFLKIVRRR